MQELSDFKLQAVSWSDYIDYNTFHVCGASHKYARAYSKTLKLNSQAVSDSAMRLNCNSSAYLC